MVKTSHHDTLGGFFINHPPIRKFQVDVVQSDHPLTRDMPESFVTIDEPYMIEVQHPSETQLLLTAELGPDNSAPVPDSFTTRTLRSRGMARLGLLDSLAALAKAAQPMSRSATATLPRAKPSPQWMPASRRPASNRLRSEHRGNPTPTCNCYETR